MSKAECTECNREFPAHLISALRSTKHPAMDVCPICALRIRNERHGLPEDTLFEGIMAHGFYIEALEYVGEDLA